jgi:hypothetical protein
MIIGQKPTQKRDMRRAPGADGIIAIAVGNRRAHRQQKHFRKRIGDLMRRARILDPAEMIEKNPQTRLPANPCFPIAHVRLHQSAHIDSAFSQPVKR